MEMHNKILEAIRRGVNLALDDYEEQLNGPIVPKKDIIRNNNSTKGLLDFYDLFIDLGLPSGTLWCKYNLGVDPKKLDIAKDWVGNYYAWGELSPKEAYNWNTYKFGDMVTRTKYNDDDFDKLETGEADGLKNLLPEDDVVIQTYRDEHFHLPTYLQLDELLSYTTCAKKQNYKGIDGLNGFVFVSNINYNSIFIPCAGQMKENELKFFGDMSCIWTNFGPFKESASTLMVEMNNFNGKLNPHYMYRYIGLTVRPVMTK